MSYTRKAPPPFQPVILFDVETEADRLAEAMVYSLYEDVKDTMNTERSKQQQIGISEIGGECLRCVARKLSLLYDNTGDQSWKAQVGTFIHAGLEEHMSRVHPITPERVPTDKDPIYHPERRLEVLDHRGLQLGGNCDLFVQGASFGLVDDWKTQGPEKLKKTAGGKIAADYIVQMHTYGYGYERLGYLVTHVVLYALPRDGDISEAKPVLMRYDRSIALEALARVQMLMDAAALVGWERVIAVQPRAGFCFDCGDYELQENKSFLDDMVG